MKQLYDNKGTPINLLQDKDMEYGSNERGNYVKFSNGILVQWGNVQKTISIKNQYGSMYYDDGYDVWLPLNFINVKYSVSVIPANKDGAVIVYSCSNYTVSKFAFNLMSPASLGQTSSFYFDWFAIGKWK